MTSSKLKKKINLFRQYRFRKKIIHTISNIIIQYDITSIKDQESSKAYNID